MPQIILPKQSSHCEPNNQQRIFFALTFSQAEQLIIDKLRDTLKAQYNNLALQWVATANLHLTLYFCGEVTMQQLNVIKDELNSALFPEIFTFSPKKITIFPNNNHPVALVLEPETSLQLIAIHETLKAAIDKILNNPDKRAYRPHITLAKIPRQKNINLSNIKTQQNIQPINIIAKNITLLSSNYTTNKKNYQTIASWPL